jgi:hypothetical protein
LPSDAGIGDPLEKLSEVETLVADGSDIERAVPPQNDLK